MNTDIDPHISTHSAPGTRAPKVSHYTKCNKWLALNDFRENQHGGYLDLRWVRPFCNVDLLLSLQFFLNFITFQNLLPSWYPLWEWSVTPHDHPRYTFHTHPVVSPSTFGSTPWVHLYFYKLSRRISIPTFNTRNYSKDRAPTPVVSILT